MDMQKLLEMVKNTDVQLYLFIGVLLLISVLCLVLLLVVSSKYAKLRKKVAEIEENVEFLNDKRQKCFDKIKVVRYNSNLSTEGGEEKAVESYSIGITSPNQDGIVVTGTKTEGEPTEIVVKSIKAGESSSELSEPEEAAISRKKSN